MTLRSCSSLLLLLTFSFPFTLAAQTPLAAKVEVRVINVDVTVTDDKGQPVTDLAPEDFEVLEDGRPQKVSNFYVIANKGMRGAEGQPVPDPQHFRRKIALLVDNNYLEKRDRDAALTRFEEFVEESFTGDYEWSIATIGQDFTLVQPFTADKAAIHEAVAKVRKTAAISFRTEADRDLLSDSLRRNHQPGSEYGGSVQFESRQRTVRNARSVLNTAQALINASRTYAPSSGRKVILLITGGMELETKFSAYDKGGDREVRDAQTEIAGLLDQMVREANTSNISISVLTARTRGMIAPQHDVENASAGFSRSGTSKFLDRDATNDPIDTANSDSAGYKLAAATGGFYLTSNVVRDSFDRADATSGNFFSLGYTPSHPEDGQYHSITVRLKKPNLRVSHRRGYLDISPEERLQQLLRLRISYQQPAAAFPVTLKVHPPNKQERTAALIAATPMKNITLLPSDGRYRGRVHLYLSIFDKNGSNVGFHHVVQDIVVPEKLRQQALGDAFRYTMNVRLDRGEFIIAVTLRDDLSSEIGTAVEKVRL